MEIPEIKQRLTLAMVLQHYGLKPDKHMRLNCPFHEDKTPSLQVYYKTHTAFCFSANCPSRGKSMDVIDFIMYRENISKHDAIIKAAELINGKQETERGTNNHSPLTINHAPLTNADRSAFLQRMFTYFKNAVYNSPPAKEYLKQRCLNPELLEIGYNSGQFHHGTRKEESLIQNCVQYGLLSPWNYSGQGGGQSYKPFAKHCIVFALKNFKGEITGLYFRSTTNDKDQRHFYMTDREGLYPAYPDPETTTLIIAESIIDTASLLQSTDATSCVSGNTSLLALYGTNGLTEEHKRAIAALDKLEEIIFFLNGDEAGRNAVIKQAENIQSIKPQVKITNAEPPENEDVNSLLQGHEPELFAEMLKNRVTVRPATNDFFLSTEEKETQLKEKTIPENQRQSESEQSQPPMPDTSLSNSQIIKFSNQLNANNPELLIYTTKEVKITVLGGIRISGLDRLKVTLKAESRTAGARIIRHSLDLYHAKQTEQLAEMMAAQLETGTSRATEIISQLTGDLENYRQHRLEAMKPKTAEEYEMSEEERQQAMSYLRDPDLMENTRNDIAAAGIIGEENNAMTGYVVNLSRKREKPLHVMYLGSSGSGKTHLQEGLSLLVPEEDRIEATGLSDQSLYYEGLKLKGKILFIEDLDGAENVIYIIRELQSKGRISKRVAWRDNKGNTKTVEVTACGPVVISSCTTREKLYEDNANRCILLYTDQSRDQDERVMTYIKAKSTGKINETQEEETRHRMRNVQRVLRPVRVYNPFAEHIVLPPEVFKPRRSLPLLLGFIETVTFYHQYQRKVSVNAAGEQYIESTYEDVACSFELMKDVLFSKSDELTKAAREFFERLKSTVKQGESFYTKDIRRRFRINANTLKRYMRELQAYGHLKAKSGSHYRGFEYEISDYEEYEQLRQRIDRRLEAILLKIKNMSGSVDMSGSPKENTHSNVLETVS
ncbi:MAG: CHC2 zinc finger domain-containing protein [Bacteroidales bacterium]